MSARLPSVVAGRVALVGDASGSVDAVTGEGLALAFRQANSLATALAAGDLKKYDASHRRMGRLPLLNAQSLLLMDGNDGLRRKALRVLAAHPRIFSYLLGLHVGGLRRSEPKAGVQPPSRSHSDIKRESNRLPQKWIF
jgi:flavin-dependent dehydrogenase